MFRAAGVVPPIVLSAPPDDTPYRPSRPMVPAAFVPRKLPSTTPARPARKTWAAGKRLTTSPRRTDPSPRNTRPDALAGRPAPVSWTLRAASTPTASVLGVEPGWV